MLKQKSGVRLSATGKSIIVDVGGQTVRRRISSIMSDVRKITGRGIALTEKFGNAPGFSPDLGANLEVPIFARRSADILDDIINLYPGQESQHSAETVAAAIEQLKTFSNSAASFDTAFYGSVAKYYGRPSLTKKQTKKALEEGKLRVPAQHAERMSRYGDMPEDNEDLYSDFKAWIIDSIPNVSARAINAIPDRDTLQDIVDEWDNMGELTGNYRQYTQRYERKNAGGRRARTKAGIKPRKPKGAT